MRILNKEEFLRLPIGTLYTNYEPHIFSGLKIKGKAIVNSENRFIDFFYQDLIGNIDFESTEDFIEKVTDAENDKEDISLCFDTLERDGCFDDLEKYAVYSKKEIEELFNKIKGCVGLG